ncbi:cell wall protein DAN4 [Folsomia candida]|uniref:cell wall protein DAN4 n=1 Tax=Folsomia candida TaxID=158441 RepID=UPI000B9016C7|nr:cell wall protein DAN4 [Folsomia candida]XP_021943858.1 cell wall protein DAN4 [Folsomia candida]
MKPVIATIALMIIGVTLTSAVDNYQAKCTITQGAGITVDSCDASKFLSCQSGRCMCNDIGNQLYDYHLEPEKVNSRTKRGLKKKIAAGVAGGAVGYVAGKAVSKGISGKRQETKLNKVFSCYGRVSSVCALDYNNVVNNNINVVPLTTTTTSTTTTTTTETPSINTTISAQELSNVTTTTTPSTSSTPTTQAPVVYDITKMPKCIRHAVCTRQTPSTSTNGHIVKTDMDPRIGVCACEPGYTATATDKCEKSGSSQILSSLPILLPMLYASVIAKFF